MKSDPATPEPRPADPHDSTPPGKVWLVGAGPGLSSLVTLRGREALARADVVIHDRLVHSSLLHCTAPHAERLRVDHFGPHDASLWSRILDHAIAQARLGKTVVRLKGGDPLIFGRLFEETERLRQAGIPYEIVPGVTAATAAAAFAEIPLTHRGLSRAVAWVTGHEAQDRAAADLDWAALARFPGTLVFYMALARFPEIARQLQAQGLATDTPAAVIASVGQGEQRKLLGTLGDMAERIREEALEPPALICVGRSIALAPAQSWYESLPLHRRRVLIARPRGQVAELVQTLEALGAIPLVQPMVRIEPLSDFAELDRHLANLGRYHWLVFTSRNGVEAFFDRLFALGRDLRAVGHCRFGVIGPGTAEALEQYHLRADVVPAEYRSETLAAALRDAAKGQTILLVRADRGRDVLREQLQAVAQVEQVAVYRQVDVDALEPENQRALEAGLVDDVLLSSSAIARGFLRALGPLGRDAIARGATRLVSISPVTSQAIREQGFEAALEARAATLEGMVAMIVADAVNGKREN